MKTAHRDSGKPAIRNLLITLAALMVTDGVISQFLIGQGLGREGNPFLADIVGKDEFLLLKLAGGMLAGLIMWDIHKRRPLMAIRSAACIVVLYTAIILWNLAVLVMTQ